MKAVPRIAALLALAACSSAGAPTEPSARPPASLRPAIGKLQLRDRMVTMFAAKDGLRVTLQDSLGKVLAEDVSVDELRDRDPFAYEACRSALGRNGSYVDATLHLPATEAAGER